jgi:hypothetical protein
LFNIVTAKDFYSLVVRDYDDYVSDMASARKAIHCAITAYHLHDWVWAEICKRNGLLKTLGIKKRKKDQFVKWIIATCPWFHAVQLLANGSKHFHFEGDDKITTLLVGGFGKGPYGKGPYGRSYLLVDFGEGAKEHRWQSALTLFEVVVRFWRDFFRAYLPYRGLPESKHHLDTPVKK